jgi:hypothetical protein
VSLAAPIVLADGLDVTFYSHADDVWFDVEPFFVEQDYRLYDATGRRLQLVPDRSVRPLEETPTGADELAGLLRVWLPVVGVDAAGLDRRTLPELLDLAVGRAGLWEPPAVLPLPRAVAVAVLLVVAVVFGAAIGASVAGTDEPALKVLQAVAGIGAVGALVAAAVQVWRERRWWPWVALHFVLIAVATAVALLSS